MRKLLPILLLALMRISYALCMWAVSVYPLTYRQLDKFHFGITPSLSLACICTALYFWQKQQKSSGWFPLKFSVLAFGLMAAADLLYLWKSQPPDKVVIEIQYAIAGDLIITFAAGCIAFIARDKAVVATAETAQKATGEKALSS
ncbi:MAG: hypothetical protein JST12_11625 [Armatimonadetes bacterium]|nr:hypothetical protein [Armatimonadota bacterium]